MIDWLYEPSQVPNGTVVALLIACAAITLLAGWLSLANKAAATSGQFLLHEAFKSASRETALLHALQQRAPEEFEKTISELRSGPLRPSQALVMAIRKIGDGVNGQV